MEPNTEILAVLLAQRKDLIYSYPEPIIPRSALMEGVRASNAKNEGVVWQTLMTEVNRAQPGAADEDGVEAQAVVKLVQACGPSAMMDAQQRDRIKVLLMEEAKKAPVDATVSDILIQRQDFVNALEADRTNESSPLARLDSAVVTQVIRFLFPKDSLILADAYEIIDRIEFPTRQLGFIKYFSKKKFLQTADLLELLIYIPFLLLFGYMSLTHKGLTPGVYESFNMGAGINDILLSEPFDAGCVQDAAGVVDCTVGSGSYFDKKTYWDIAEVDDLYDFLKGPFLRGLWPDTGTARSTTLGQEHAIQPIGALKVRQLRVGGIADPLLHERFFGTPTVTHLRFPAYERELVSELPYGPGTGPFAYKSCDEVNGTLWFPGKLATYTCSGHATVIPFDTTRAQANAVFDFMSGNNWVDEATRAVFLEMMFFQPSSAMSMYLRLVIEISEGGGYAVTRDQFPFAFNAHEKTWHKFFYAFHAYLLAYILYSVIAMIRRVRRRGCKLHVVFPSMWDVGDAINFTLFAASFALRTADWLRIDVNEDPIWQATHYPNNYEFTAFVFTQILIIDAFTAMLSFMRLLKFGRHVPGLDVVSDILERSKYDQLAILFIFVVIFSGMVLCGHVVYGDKLIEFSTFGRSFQTLGLYLIGEFDYDILTVRKQFAPLFFAVFQSLIVLLLLNMVIAVFTEAFEAVQEEEFDPKQMWAVIENDPYSTITPPGFFSYIASHPWYLMPASGVRKLVYYASSQNGPTPVGVLRMFDRIHNHLKYLGDANFNVAVKGAAELLTMVGQINPAALNPLKDTGNPNRRCLHEFLEEQLGSMNYHLAMPLFVLYPEATQGINGAIMLVELLEGHQEYSTDKSHMMRGDLNVESSEELEVMEIDLRRVLAELVARSPATDTTEITDLKPVDTTDMTSPATWERDIIALQKKISLRRSKGAAALQTFTGEHAALLVALATKMTPELIKQHRYLTKDAFDELWEAFGLDVELGEKAFYVLRLYRKKIDLMSLHEEMTVVMSERSFACGFNFPEEDRLQRYMAVNDYPLWDRAKFTEAWQAATDSPPKEEIMNKVFSFSLDGLVDAKSFAMQCTNRVGIHAHRSFNFLVYEASLRRIEGILSLIFFLPFIALMTYFVLIDAASGIYITKHLNDNIRDDNIDMGCNRNNCSLVNQPLMFEKNFVDIGTINDFTEWLQAVPIDKVWGGLDTEPATALDGVNYPVGALKIRQRRVAPTDCSRTIDAYFGIHLDKLFEGFQGGVCYGPLHSLVGAVDTSLYAPPGVTDPQVFDAFRFRTCDDVRGFGFSDMQTGLHGCAGHTLMIPLDTTKQRATQLLGDVLNAGWIDKQTRFIAVEFVFFNYNSLLFSYSRFAVELAASGGVYPRAQTDILKFTAVSNYEPWQIFLLAMYFLFCFLLGLFYFRAIITGAIQRAYDTHAYTIGEKLGSFVSVFFGSPTNIVDLGIIVLVVLVWAVRFAVFSVNPSLVDYNFPESVEELAGLGNTLAYIDGVLVIVVYARFLHFMRFSRRLNLLTLTIQRAFTNLLSILVLFVVVMVAFVFTGHTLYAFTLEDFYSISASFNTLFLVLLGAADYAEWQEERREISAIFFVAFLIVCFFIMFNLIVAVLADAFSQVKKELFDPSIAEYIAKKEFVFEGGFVQRYIRRSPIIDEIRYFFNYLKTGCSAAKLPSGKLSARKFWQSMRDAQLKVDIGPPEEMVAGSIDLLRMQGAFDITIPSDVNLEESGLDVSMALAPREEMTAVLPEAANPLAVPKPGNEKPGDEPASELAGDNDIAPASPRKRAEKACHFLRTRETVEEPLNVHSGVRLPLWDEYLHYRFGDQKNPLLQALVFTPGRVLRASKFDLLMMVLEVHHYWTQDRQLYTPESQHYTGLQDVVDALKQKLSVQ